ncbi:GDSL esterase/lipase At3g48460-like [Camellia sinensis]|uniref:GDSL esterase/lipase At3g48460-like n=1 Tax=Camellia sinensis TaxID=4442 RepID=UPI00103643FF|nr:GDSL esterase/lipase At3g48460-like [Camellia sinensis]
MYAFGDSYIDTGNTGSTSGPSGFSYVSNLPYGCTYFHHSTNRYSDGRLVIDLIAQSLSLPYLPPYIYLINSNQKPSLMGVNFAVVGSTAIIQFLCEKQPHTQHHSSIPSNLAHLVQQLLGVSGV